MTRYSFLMWLFSASAMSMAVARPGLRGLPPELLVLMLRMTLPITPYLSALYAGGHVQSVMTVLT